MQTATAHEVSGNQSRSKRIRGPQRVEYIPDALRSVQGIEKLTTVRQMRRLVDYRLIPAEDRPAFVRLGASVPPRVSKKTRKGSSTYAVDVDGEVRIVRLDGDPRRVYVWVRNAKRPWNLCRDTGLRNERQNARFNAAWIAAQEVTA